jgi:catechol 2,3-dioxygenase-like lactoylglutathione lyase family enzyme
MNPLSLPGGVRQIGYVVTDLDSAIDDWVRMGVGPWYVMRELPLRTLYRGQSCEVVQSIAMANSGPLQVELIQQHGDTPSIFTEFLATHGPGFHQLAWWVEDFDAALDAAKDAGFPVVWQGADDGGVPFVYVEPPGGPVAIIEIMQLNELTEGMASLVGGAAEGWDGSDPVRSLTG